MRRRRFPQAGRAPSPLPPRAAAGAGALAAASLECRPGEGAGGPGARAAPGRYLGAEGTRRCGRTGVGGGERRHLPGLAHCPPGRRFPAAPAPPPPRAHGERCQGGPSQIEPVPGWGVESGSAERRGPAPGPSRLGCARDVCRMYSGGRARTGGGARGRAGWDLLSAGLGRSSPAPV